MPLIKIPGRKTYFLLAIILLLAGIKPVRAQLVASFTSDVSSGCPGLSVNFKNTSTGTSASSVYTWIFGNGNGITTSIKNGPIGSTYFTGGVYHVQLIIKDGAQTSTAFEDITIHDRPDIKLTASRTVGCSPLDVDFTSAIAAGSGTITSVLWNFGDGNSQNTVTPNVSNIYKFPGTYNVSLTATNSFGCFTPVTIPNMITVYPALVPAFTVDSTAICSVNQSVQFYNGSTGDGSLSYTWNFGGGPGDTSNLPNPAHLYPAKGTYDVSLTVSNTYGCSSNITKPALINLANHTADFITNASYCPGNTIVFINKSTPAPSSTPIWSFGDGGSGIGNSFGHVYTTNGNYTVKMYENFGSCPDSVIKVINILAAPNISPFILNKGTSCSSPMTVYFQDTSAGATNWHWNFTGNPGDTSDSQNPFFTYNTNGLFSPTLTISNSNGCSSTVSETFNTALPTATIHADTVLIPDPVYCADVQATFKAISADTLATYFWSFGDGTTSTAANPVHIFSKPGTYIINLSFTTIHGCNGGAFPSDTIIVYPKPHASFNAYDSLPCTTNQLETFINLDDSAAKFTWFYGDGQSDTNSNVVHYHQYNAQGNYTMTLVASSPGCPDDDTTIVRFVKTTPIPKLTVQNNCDSNRLSAKLTVTPGGGTQYIWHFGDGSPDETDNVYIPTKNHHFPIGGRYIDSVNVLYGTCWQTTGPLPVYVLDNQHPILSSTKDTICQTANFPVKITGVDTNYHSKATNAANYYKVVKWQYNDGTTFNANNGFKMTYTGNLTNLLQGEDSIRAIIQSDFFGCFDTTNYIPIHMIGPIAKFSDQNQLCYRSPIIFTDSSSPGANNAPIVSWKWDFNDGNTTIRPTGDTVQHIYAFPGTYNPKLTVTDTNGCVSPPFSKPVTQILVYGVKANFTWKPTSITPGFPIEFYNTSIKNTGVNYLWTFASDGSTSTSPDSLTHVFPNVGTDTVTLIALPTMPGACPDTLIQILQIQNIAAPFIDSSYYIGGASCPPLGVNFTSFPTATVLSLKWNFGDSTGPSFKQNPFHQYNTPGVYIVSLTGYGANGISVISYDTITVKGPYAKLYSPLYQACAPATDTLHATASYVGSFTWDFGDGTLAVTTDSSAVHTYLLPGMFTPSVILKDSTGCTLSYKSDNQILIDTIHATLPPPTTLCGLGSILYGPYVVSYVNDTLPAQFPLNYHWNFGTGNPADTSNLRNPSFNYTTPGDYITTFQVTSPVGCTAVAYDSVHVIGPFPMPASPDTTICIGGTALLWADGANTYLWAPASTLNKATGDSVIAKPPATTSYTVIGEDKYKCFLDTASIKVTVDSLPVVTIPTPDPVLAGSDVQLDPTVSADVVSWDWTPPLYLSCTDCASPISTPLAPTTYTVTVKTATGCTSSTSVTIKLLCLQSGVYMANAFSPNNDGNNDYFYPTGSGVKMVKSFQIYSRWGQLLYSRTDFPPNDKKYGWDGNLNGIPQPADTYVYVTEMICFTGENFVLKGTVELLR
jgi:gliding motility-associated-like protein